MQARSAGPIAAPGARVSSLELQTRWHLGFSSATVSILLRWRWRGDYRRSRPPMESRCTCPSMEPATLHRKPCPRSKPIDRADRVLAIITTAANQMVQHELRYALEHKNLVIPIVGADLVGHRSSADSLGSSHSLRGTIPAQLNPKSWNSSKSSS